MSLTNWILIPAYHPPISETGMYDEEGRAALPPQFTPRPPSEVPRQAVPAWQLAPPIEGMETRDI